MKEGRKGGEFEGREERGERGRERGERGGKRVLGERGRGEREGFRERVRRRVEERGWRGEGFEREKEVKKKWERLRKGKEEFRF